MDDNHRHEFGRAAVDFSYCPMCGEHAATNNIAGRRRENCPACGWVHFRNPGVSASVLVRDPAGEILLVKRGPNATRAGQWSIPGGFVEYGEDVREGAARELREETGLMATIGDAIHVATNFHDLAKITVGIWFSCTVIGGSLQPGDDAADVGWFPPDALPDLAFDTDAALFTKLRFQSD